MPVLHHFHDNFEVAQIVIDDESCYTADIDVRCMGCRFYVRHRLLKMGGEMESASGSHNITFGGGLPGRHGTFNPDMAIHQCYQLLGYRQPQTCAAIFACGASICLGKSTENRFLFFLGYPDTGIPDRKNQVIWIPVADFGANHQDNLALVRKFDSVADEVENNLADS